MKFRLYPPDQIEKYLLIDMIALVFLFYHVITADGPFGLIGDLFLLSLFLYAFYMMLWHRDWRLLLFSLLSCAVLSVFGIFYNEWLLLYGLIIADLLGRARSKSTIAIGMVGISAMFLGTHFYGKGDLLSFGKTAFFPILIIQLLVPIVISIREGSKLLKRELATANKKIERYIQEEERHRIARDLHDTLGQTLTMITLKSELAVRLMDKNSTQAKQEIEEVIRTTRFALKQVRELVTSMSHVSLKDEIEHAGKLLHTSGIALRVQRNTSPPKLSAVAETMLALSLRESITNVIKHSQASICIIEEVYREGWFQIRIEDNGIGLNKEARGNGISFMRERMRLLQGEMHLSIPAGGGNRVTLKIPVKD